MKKVLGLDLGTNSIGWSIRELNLPDNQIINKGVLTFEKGVGEDQGKEVPLVQKRTESRSKRRNYQAKKYRKWELLETLILNEPKLCPLSIEELDGWRKYEKGKERVYPQSELFLKWLRLDFIVDGKSEYKNPYELRKEAAEKKLDDTYALGRAFYHMVQRRGFRGRDEAESETILKGSTEKETVGANEIQSIIAEEKTTLGGALHLVQEKYNKRIRNRYNLRTDVEEELKLICKVQGIDENSDLFHKLYKSIIWQRPLRTQKGNVGRCTLEPSKPRCPLSHPLYEEYRMLSFINNIRIKSTDDPDNQELPLNDEQKKIIIQKVFFGKKKNKDDFEFTEIIKALDKKADTLEFNYKPYTTISGCPVTFTLREIFGCELSEIKIAHKPNEKRKSKKDYYNYNDLWHALFTFDSKEKLETFAKEKLSLADEKAKAFSKIRIPKGYASLSLNAINKILPFLHKGFIYSEAVYLANLQKVFGKQLSDREINKIAEGIRLQMKLHKRLREELSVVNSLIGDYLNKPSDEQIGRYPNYTLIDKDRELVEQKIMARLGKKRWEELDSERKSEIKQFVEKKYQEFLQTPKNTEIKLLYHKLPRLDDLIKDHLKKEWDIQETNLKYLYHPSETELYRPANEIEGKKYLGDPVPISKGFKNPMALKTLYHLKHLINYLIKEDKIDEETRVVVEIARELNDANKRKAIDRYQRDREKQNQEFAKAINEFAEQERKTIETTDEIIDKYRLWIEQGRQCLYTGKMISLTELFDGTKFDFEHTIPADISFDNELKNLTVADSVYNRQIKQKQIPYELPNYEKDVEIDGIIYSAIKPRLKFIEDKVKHFKEQVERWKKESKRAQNKERKDQCIQNRHYNQFELDYWTKKLDTFTIKEYNPQWRNSQLRDTQIITKYALHYLKTVFDKVEVQKGTVTSEFRKIFNVGFEKERSKHTHHAIDAAVLTLIPPPTIRDRLLKEHFAAMENNIHFHSKPSEWNNFNPSSILNIESDTLVNYIAQNRALIPTKKNVRKRGRIQYVKEKLENGKWRYKLDENGNRIPLIAQGDSIRGQLHKETFYGAIKENSDENISYIVRKPLKSFKSEKEFDDIVDPIVKKVLSETISERMKNGKSFKEAIAEPIWMVDSKGNFKKTDKNGKTLLPIRHIRVKTNEKNLLEIKKHIHLSNQEHKQKYYAANSTNFLYGLYEDEKGNKGFIPLNLLEATDIRRFNEIKKLEDFFENKIILKRNKKAAVLKAILKPGQRVIFYVNDNREELKELSKKDLLKRTYFIKRLYDANTGTIQFQHHLEARTDDELLKAFPKEKFGQKGKNGFSEFKPEVIYPRLLLSPKNFNFILEGIDFEITLDGEIIMKK